MPLILAQGFGISLGLIGVGGIVIWLAHAAWSITPSQRIKKTCSRLGEANQRLHASYTPRIKNADNCSDLTGVSERT